ncbi:MAG: SGNH/GDSL hydrolase family protein [Cyanobacteria bacterium P01_G01_bin.49]
MVKLVAIGDSLTQGFQSGAIFHTDRSFPVMIARSIGLNIEQDFLVPKFPGSGLPLNIEAALRYMEQELGQDINLFEWITKFPSLFGKFTDQTETIYETGVGSQPVNFTGVYHNLGIWGFRVIDTLTVNANYCQMAITASPGSNGNGIFQLPSVPMYRTALRVLNPQLQSERMAWTQIDNLEYLVATEGVENIIIWLGANDCLGTVLDLKLKDMLEDMPSNDSLERREFNLTHPDTFKRDYESMVAKVKDIIPPSTQVFVGTIPLVTIPPVTQGINNFEDGYFDYYARFFADADNFSSTLQSHLTREEAILIDRRIDLFNEIIRNSCKLGGDNWHVVEIGEVLQSLSIKRQKMLGKEDEVLKRYYQNRPDHPLLQLTPLPNTLRFSSFNNKRLSGGLFSLDGVHPTSVGYGIIAEAYLAVMNQVGVANADVLNLDWERIISTDRLFTDPPLLWDDIVRAAQNNATLWDLLFKALV